MGHSKAPTEHSPHVAGIPLTFGGMTNDVLLDNASTFACRRGNPYVGHVAGKTFYVHVDAPRGGGVCPTCGFTVSA
jgi:hypothetical protein